MAETKTNCFAYSEKMTTEWIPAINRSRKFLHLECSILRRMYCTFEECTFYKTQAFLDAERARCAKRWERIKKERERERKQQTKGKAV